MTRAGAPYFSLIIPTYNRADKLAKNLRNLFNQQFEPFEIIIVDDGSTDNTEEVITKLNDLRVRYLKTHNHERSFARNYGLRHASGKYINYFDSDDIMYPDRLQKVHDFILSNAEPEVLYTHYDFVNEGGVKIGQMQRHYRSFTKDILYNNFLGTDAVFLKRDVALQFQFHEDRQIITAEDWELWLRVHTVFNFVEYPVSTFAMVEHENRSLNTLPAPRIENRDLYFSRLIIEDVGFKNKYGRYATNLFIADRYTFIALSHSLDHNSGKAMRYLMLSVETSIAVLFRKRFWATLKKILWRERKY